LAIEVYFQTFHLIIKSFDHQITKLAEMSVIVDSLTKVYGTQKAVNGISFEAKKGEILGFLGPNGAGKSTTMKMLTCFIPQSSGKATVCGYDIETHPMEVRKRVGYLPQDNPLYKDMYVEEYLLFIARLHKLQNRKAKVAEMIERTGLELEAHKLIGALSGGYQQRVGLAQAMLHDPEVLILDEPTSGLDPNQLVDIRQLIKQLGEEKTVIFSSHIMQEVQALCDRVLIINHGNLVANDSIETLRHKVAGEKIISLEVRGAIKTEAFRKIEGVETVKSLGNGRFQLFSKSKEDVRPDIFRFIVDQNLVLLEMQQESSSIEDIFQKLTKSRVVEG
jgi:ABC-2 type transport system ATP-binding protein